MKEQRESAVLSLDQTLTRLAERIVHANKPVVIASDLDDTLSNSHIFDATSRTHIPQLKPEMCTSAKMLRIPLLIATGRPADDPSVLVAWKMLSRSPMPIICENGGVIVENLLTSPIVRIHPHSNYMRLQRIASLLPDALDELRHQGVIPEHFEILVDKTRKTSVEIRIQDIVTKVGIPLVHRRTSSFLHSIAQNEHLVAVSSGSSVSLHAPEITKGGTVLGVLASWFPEREDFFLVTLGDNANDASLFVAADLGIGVGEDTIGLSDVTCIGGETVALAVMQKIHNLNI